MHPTKILIVEDDSDIQAVLAVALEDIGGYTVVACTSGTEALERSDCAPDLLLLDVMMPELDGPATLRLLRSVPMLWNTPAIFLTARSQNHAALQHQDTQVLGVITKPFDPRRLVEQIQTLWGASHVPLVDSLRLDKRAHTSNDLPGVALVRQEYQHGLLPRITELRALWANPNRASLEQMRQELHRLGGSGRTLGFAALSRQARVLEVMVSKVLQSSQYGRHELAAQIDADLASLADLAQTIQEAPLEWPDDPSYDDN